MTVESDKPSPVTALDVPVETFVYSAGGIFPNIVGTILLVGALLIVGAAFETGANPTSRTNVKGYIRGYDARTGKRLWIFHTIPRPGEFGNETWEKDSWSYTGNTGVWAQMSADPELGLVYLPVELPTGDHYGGHRPGNGLFGESIVAVDLKTGKRKWHYQFTPHDLHDWDSNHVPVLAEVPIAGQVRKVVMVEALDSILMGADPDLARPVAAAPYAELVRGRSAAPGRATEPNRPMVFGRPMGR